MPLPLLAKATSVAEFDPVDGYRSSPFRPLIVVTTTTTTTTTEYSLTYRLGTLPAYNGAHLGDHLHTTVRYSRCHSDPPHSAPAIPPTSLAMMAQRSWTNLTPVQALVGTFSTRPNHLPVSTRTSQFKLMHRRAGL
jgi:hypothetical protein